MMSHDAIPELDRKGLREFGLVTGAIVTVLFGLFFPWLIEVKYPLWPWIFAAIISTWALLLPNTLNPVYKIWMRFGIAIGFVMNHVVLSLVFFLIISPIGLMLRLSGKDPMKRKLDKQIKSYRIKSNVKDKLSLERPF